MKKIITSLMALSLIFGASAQDGDILKNKKGTPILPKAGDFALQMNANPLLDFGLNAVNIMNNTGQTSAHPGFTAGQNPAFTNYIVGKYFLSSSTALRLKLGYTSSTDKEETYGDNPINPSNASPSNILLSTEKDKSNAFILGGGMEFRRGYGRLQGYYGGELNLTFASVKLENEYEIAYFGILEEYQNKKLGSYLLSKAIKKSFVENINRVWVHTCSLDHKNALTNYINRGMKIFKTEIIKI